MISQESMMKKKLENMHLKERIDYGYRKVITMNVDLLVCFLL